MPTKYQPLFDFLAEATDDEVVLTFTEVATRIGGPLPESAILRPAWWANQSFAQVQTWRAMGWQARADRDNQRVRFTRNAEEHDR